jgi:glycosyl transferase family 25
MEHIDAILFINLEHRTDRRDHILEEIHKFCQDDSKIHRIDAIQRDEGALGCGFSHIKALNYTLNNPEWNIVLILEDDFTFKSNSSEEIKNSINLLVTTSQFDVGLLSHNKLESVNTDHDSIKKVVYSQTTSSYLIKKHYIPTLIQNMTEAMYDMARNGKRHENCLDIYWSRLMPTSNWYAIYPSIGYQYGSYSDIEKHYTSYGC